MQTYEGGHRKIFYSLHSTQRAITSAKNIVLQKIIHYCLYEHIFSYIILRSIEGKSVVRSWDNSAMHGLAAMLKTYFSGRTVIFEVDSRNLVD